MTKTGCCTGTTWGILKQSSYFSKQSNFKNGYLIKKVNPGVPFLKEGDSGSLVKVQLDDTGSLGVFAYAVGICDLDNQEESYLFLNLKKSFEFVSDLVPRNDLVPCLINCQEEEN